MKRHFLKIIGILIFVYILFKVDISEVLEALTRARIDYILIVFSLAIPVILVKSWRWQYLLKMQDVDYSLKNAFTAYLSSGYLGIITPGKIGEFAKAFYLKEDEGISIGKAFSSVFTDRLLDLIVLLIVGVTGILCFSLEQDIVLPALLILMSVMAVLIIFLNKRLRDKLFHFTKLFPFIRTYKTQIEIYYNNFFNAIDDFKNIKMLIPIAASLLAYFIFYCSCYLMVLSLGIQISFSNIIFCISIANIISLIPISISGIGTRDATLILLFSFLGLNKEVAMSFSIIFLAILYLSIGIFGGIACLKKPLKI